jgi:Holliday junction resolvasome RuvABC endonuclease subunit
MKRTNRPANWGNILTNDPSMTAWGWVVLDWNGLILDSGCIKTQPQAKKKRIREGDDFVQRIHHICTTLSYIIETYDIRYLLSELPHGSQNARAAKMIGAVPAIIQTISILSGIAVEWYSEGDVKKHLFGKQNVTKEEMKNKVDSLISVQWPSEKYKCEAIADALGVYLTAKDQSTVITFLKIKRK